MAWNARQCWGFTFNSYSRYGGKNLARVVWCKLFVYGLSIVVVSSTTSAQTANTASENPGIASITPARFVLSALGVQNTSVLTTADIDTVTTRWRGKLIGGYELLVIARELTALYTDKGYSGSGVVLGDQAIELGVVRFHAREVHVSNVSVSPPPRWIREGAIAHMVWPNLSTPLHLPTLQDRIAMMRDSPHIKRIDADLAVGLANPSEATLKLAIEEPPPISVWLSAANNRSPSIGAVRKEAGISHRSLLGWGDSMELRAGQTEGLNDSQISYNFPIPKTRFTLSYSRGRADSRAIEPRVFRDLDIVALSNSDTVGVNANLFRSPATVANAGFTHDRRRSSTSLLGFPFSFTLGIPEGESTVTANRVSGEFVFRDPRMNGSVRVIATSGKVNPAADAGIPGAVAPSFKLLQLGATYVMSFSTDRLGTWELRTRIDAQHTRETLAPVERMSFGGVNGVRGYRENLFLRDKGVIARVELNREAVEVFKYLNIGGGVFADAGWGRDVFERADALPRSISSVGVSIETRVTPYFRLTTQYARPRDRSFSKGGNLQDRGVHLSAVLSYP